MNTRKNEMISCAVILKCTETVNNCIVYLEEEEQQGGGKIAEGNK